MKQFSLVFLVVILAVCCLAQEQPLSPEVTAEVAQSEGEQVDARFGFHRRPYYGGYNRGYYGSGYGGYGYGGYRPYSGYGGAYGGYYRPSPFYG